MRLVAKRSGDPTSVSCRPRLVSDLPTPMKTGLGATYELILLTDLLIADLDNHGHGRTEPPSAILRAGHTRGTGPRRDDAPGRAVRRRRPGSLLVVSQPTALAAERDATESEGPDEGPRGALRRAARKSRCRAYTLISPPSRSRPGASYSAARGQAPSPGANGQASSLASPGPARAR